MQWPIEYRQYSKLKQAYLWLRYWLVWGWWKLHGSPNPVPNLYPIIDPFVLSWQETFAAPAKRDMTVKLFRGLPQRGIFYTCDPHEKRMENFQKRFWRLHDKLQKKKAPKGAVV